MAVCHNYRSNLNRRLLLPRIKDAEVKNQSIVRKRRRKQGELLRKCSAEIQEGQTEKWLQSTGRFPPKRWKIEQKRALKAWFDQLDVDGSGEIDVDELTDPLMSIGLAKTMTEVNNLVNQVDGNKSSGICFEEFLSVMKSDNMQNDAKHNHEKRGKWPNVSTAKSRAGGYRNKKTKREEEKNPIVQLTERQQNVHMEFNSVLSCERRKLLLDATMVQAEKRERAHKQITRWRAEMKALQGPSKFKKLQDISTLIQHLETDRVEKEHFVEAMRGMLNRIQTKGGGSNKQRDALDEGRGAMTNEHRASMKRRNISMLERARLRRQSMGKEREALAFTLTSKPSLPSLLGIRQKGLTLPSV